ncbi:GntR family transcriptional regulator [Altererythrobacter sp. MF3-039]|uniref:GntR family transcriptional regulator n=1 Tax=Altererythrobacter sp. MF3-039 TaxID=3252901 RepID=UPI00390C527D
MISSDHSYNEIRRQILEGELKPGAPLKERDLCAQMGISRTPIREALRRLVADGLAEMQPRRSIVVSSYSAKELAEIFELGSILETHVAGLAAEKATPEDVENLRLMLQEMQELLDNEPSDVAAAYARFDQQFHDGIAKAARNDRIAQMLRQTVSLRWLASLMRRYSKDDFQRSLSHHKQIVDAIAARDPSGAREEMATHVGSGRDIGIDQFEEDAALPGA